MCVHRSLDGAHGQHHSICKWRQNCSLCGASANQKRWSQHGGQVRGGVGGFTDVLQTKMFIGFSAACALSHPYWCRPNKNTLDLSWTREEKNRGAGSDFLWWFSLCLAAMWLHYAPKCSIQCVYICVFCLECPVMACACTDGYQTDRQTNTQSVRGGQEEDSRSFFTRSLGPHNKERS